MFLLTSALLAPAFAQDAPAAAPENPLDVSGVYAIWALNQHGFLLGKDAELDDADYVVQMLRLNAKWTKEHYGVVSRADAAQGWWGTDNDPNVEAGVYNPYKMFRDKDTNYDIHFDHAYAWVEVPALPLKVLAGRQPIQAGHKLVLDQDMDGVLVRAEPADVFSLDAMWMKVSEGENSTKVPTGLLMHDDGAYADADLYGGRAFFKLEPATVEAYGFYYMDNTGTGASTYLPNGYGYLNSRFRPNISTLTAFGLSVDGNVEVADGLLYEVEGSYLMGTDDVKNGSHEGGTVDINNGTLSGYNAYAKVTQKFTAGVPMDFGVIFGMGSGDDDVTKGDGNVNKIMTAGFFPFTNVWEDSVMPDVGGISPQGLGSPVSRGYREFENTTAFAGKLGVKPVDPLRLEVLYAYMMATQPIVGFDETGEATSESATDIGQEIDVNLHWNVWKGFGYKALFGIFLPGDAAGYLINGNTNTLEPAWEVKQVVTAAF